MSERPTLLFREEQHFNRALTILVVIGCLVPLAIVGAVLYRQLVMGQPFGTRPVPDGLLIAVFIGHLLLDIALIWLFLSIRMVTEVRSDGLFVQFRPFHRTERRINGIQGWKAREYRPLREYGGWGIRVTWRGDGAYNTGGTRGVELELEGGKRLMIGSRKADSLATALGRALGEPGPRGSGGGAR